MASALYNMGNNLVMADKFSDAKPLFMKASDIFKQLLIGLYKEKGRVFESEKDYENLKQESAYDVSDEIKEINKSLVAIKEIKEK